MGYSWPLINDNITQRDREVLADFCLNGERFTNGNKVKEFEKAWSKWLGVKHSVMVNSGASANFISIAMVKELLGVGEVIVPPIGWVSDISSVVQLGMTPIFVDVDINNFNITAENIKAAITKNTKAIVLVHTLGFNAITDEIVQIAKDNDIILIEDCCEAHGAKFGDKRVGSIGDISLFSFYFGHHITTIEGGTVCVNNDKLYDLAKLFRSHGMTREASTELQTEYQQNHPDLNPLFTFAVAGFNMRSTELNAVLGLEQLQRLDYNIERRRDNLDIWLKHLDPSKFKTSFDVEGNSNFALPLVMQESYRNSLKINDDYSSVCDVLDLNNVEYRLGTAGGGNQARQPYLKKYPYRISGELKNADYIHDNALYIGNHTDLTKEQIIDLCKKLNNV
ncbi:CDP-4-dehydro-6-deoxyglucose reductase, E1 [Gammaproteobacteria bacterium]